LLFQIHCVAVDHRLRPASASAARTLTGLGIRKIAAALGVTVRTLHCLEGAA
jgi:hypothetical protein